MNDISRLNNDTNLENIIKEYSEKYRKVVNKPQIKAESNSVIELPNNNDVNNNNNQSTLGDNASSKIFYFKYRRRSYCHH